MESVGIGLVGCGSWGRFFSQAISNTPEVRMVAVADLNYAQAEKIASNYPGTIALADPAKLLEIEEIAGVIVVTPTPTHEQIVCTALQAGKHVLVEKPMAVNLLEAKRMVAVADNTQRHLMVGQIMRFLPATQELRQRITNGEIGQPLHVVERRYGSFRKDAWPEWWLEMDGFLLLHLGSHSVDAILWMLNSHAQWAFAQGKARNVDSRHGAIDAFALTLGLDGDVLAGIHHEAGGGDPNMIYSLLIVGDRGKLELDEFTTVRLNGEIVYQQTEEPFLLALKAELKEFSTAIRLNRAPSVSGKDVLPTVAALDAASRSLHTGCLETIG